MDREQLTEQIEELERQVAYKKTAKPAHDHRGIFERELFELEETLDEKRRALKELSRREQVQHNDGI